MFYIVLIVYKNDIDNDILYSRNLYVVYKVFYLFIILK